MSLTAGKVLKAAVLNKDAHELLASDPDLFGVYEPAFRFINEYYVQYQAAPTISIMEEKFGDDIFEDVGDASGSTKHYIGQLRQEYLRSGVEDLLLKAGKAINSRPPLEILERLAARAASLSAKAGTVADVDIMDTEIALDVFKKAREDNATGNFAIRTGIAEWDEFSGGGLQPGQNVVLFGYSGKGKSWVADFLVAQAYLQGKKVLVVSLEMTDDQQRNRIWSIIGNGKFHMRDLQRGQVSDEDIKRFGSETLNTGGNVWVIQAPPTGATPAYIRSKVERYQPDLVVIDYLQLAEDDYKTKDLTPRMLNVSRSNKTLAMEKRIPVVTISAVTDEESKKRNSPPLISQLAWSRAIEFDADMALAVHRYENTNILEIACRKNRNGELFNVQYNIDLSRGIFEPRDESDEEE